MSAHEAEEWRDAATGPTAAQEAFDEWRDQADGEELASVYVWRDGQWVRR